MTLEQRFQFMESQAAHIESRIRMIRHGSIQYPELVGISREASPHADSIVYYSYDGTGDMIDIANRGNDYPLVEISQQQHTVGIHWKGLAYDWSDREIGRAMLVGVPLSDRKVRIAFRIWEEQKERVFLNGDAAKGWDGILNHADIPVENAAQAWADATDKQIFNDVNELIGGAWEGTNQVRLADTLLLPVAQLIELNRPMGDNANRSVLEYIKENNPLTAMTGRPLMIRTLRQLKGAAPAHGGNAQDRVIAYPRDMEVIRYHVPQELQFIEPQRIATVWKYHGHGVLAGLEIMEPSAMRYLDRTGNDA